RRGGRAGFLAAQVVGGVTHKQVAAFSRRLGEGLTVRSDAFSGLTVLARDHAHEPRPTPPEKAGEWLPLVHLVISNFKRFLIGTFHGVSQKRLQEYLDEFVFRFNRRFWEDQLPARLAEAALPRPRTNPSIRNRKAADPLLPHGGAASMEDARQTGRTGPPLTRLRQRDTIRARQKGTRRPSEASCAGTAPEAAPGGFRTSRESKVAGCWINYGATSYNSF
ncbi:MAG: transposase, partial [Gammaproteobacteria bacterium]|nr:transposase [Gammaproteobacteria bacterium]